MRVACELAIQGMFDGGVSQWGQKCRRFSNPIREGGTVEIKSIAVEDLALVIKG